MSGVIDEKTDQRRYPLPHPDNTLDQDVERLRAAFSAVDRDVQTLLLKLRRERVLRFLNLNI